MEKFQPTDVAQQIALACEGEETPSAYPPYTQKKFRLTDGRTWYASLSVAKKVEKFAVGELLKVCLREYAKGKTTLDVRAVDATSGEPSVSSAAIPLQKPVTEISKPLNGITTNGHANGHAMPEAKFTSDVEQQLVASLDQHRFEPPPEPNGNGHAKLNGAHAEFYLGKACELIDVVVGAQQYAAAKYAGTFSQETVRLLVTTMYIQNCGKGGGR